MVNDGRNLDAQASPTRVRNPRFERADSDELRSHQTKLLLQMLRHVQETNGFYSDLWRDVGIDVTRIGSIEEFRKAIPLVQKSDFTADQERHPPYGRRLEHARRQQRRLDYYTTSGTSGQGVEVHAQTVSELAGMVECYSYGFTWAGLTPGDIVGMTIPITMFAGGRVELQGAEGNGLSVLPMGNYDVERKLDVIEKFRPAGLLSSSSYLAHLAARHPAPATLGVGALLTGMEAASLDYLNRLEEDWQARAFDRFGCAQMRTDFMFTCERGVGTLQRPGLLHNVEPLVLLEVIDPVTGGHVGDGEYGELVVTSLYHTDTPLIRCRLRDGGVYRAAHYCRCGRAFPGVEVASISRTDDVRKIKGVNVFPQTVDSVVFASTAVDEYRVELRSAADASDVATVVVMLNDAVPSADSSALCAAVSEGLRRRTGIQFEVIAGDVARSEYKASRWADLRVR